jgi:Family of unknown function (DUF6776)
MKPLPVHNRHLISIQRPELWIASAVSLVLVLLLIIWLAFDYGRQQAGYNQSETDEYAAKLQQQIEELTKQKNNLHRDNSRLAMGHNIDRDASSQVNKTLADSQAKIVEMKEELLFYRNVMSPNASKRSVEIKKIQLLPTAEGEFKYKLQLIQNGRHDVAARGVVEISLEGEKPDGQTVRLAMPSITTTKAPKRQKFGFKYFQNFEGGIRIPQEFVPTSMYIRVLPRSSKIPKVDKSFTWNDILNVGDQDHVGQIENQSNQN